MVTGYSWVIVGWMLPSRLAPGLLWGHSELLQRLGSTPRASVWDNESAVGSWREGGPRLTAEPPGEQGADGLIGAQRLACAPSVVAHSGTGDVRVIARPACAPMRLWVTLD
jgi:hypothetical protein